MTTRRSLSSIAAFSLVETALAIGVIGFAFVSLLTLLPVGLANFRSAIDTTVCAQIFQRVISDAEQADFDRLTGTSSRGAGQFYILPTRYFDDQGIEVVPRMPGNPSAVEGQQIIYHVHLRGSVPGPESLDAKGTDLFTSLPAVAGGRRFSPRDSTILTVQIAPPSRFCASPDGRQFFVGGATQSPGFVGARHLFGGRHAEWLSASAGSMKRYFSPRPRTAFTLIELLVSTAVIGMLVVILASITNETSTIWRRTNAKAEQFREARNGFELMTTRLSQAALNAYWDYQLDPSGRPLHYERRSELRFICGPALEVMGTAPRESERPTHCVFFQAPFGESEEANYRGFENLLTARGYWVQFGDDADLRPPFLSEDDFPVRHRYRLMEFSQPAEANSIYQYTSGTPSYAGREWFREPLRLPRAPVHILAENVIALIITPRLARPDEFEVKGIGSDADSSPIAPDYLYDTSPVSAGASDSRYRDTRLNPTHQLPPLLQVTMVAIDEISALHLDFNAGTRDPFAIASRFRRSAEYTKDLSLVGDATSLENTLVEMGVNYRTFSTNVVIRGAKWSREKLP